MIQKDFKKQTFLEAGLILNSKSNNGSKGIRPIPKLACFEFRPALLKPELGNSELKITISLPDPSYWIHNNRPTSKQVSFEFKTSLPL